MIKRKYFFSVKVAHNDNSGKYSWWHTVYTHKSLFKEEDQVMVNIRCESASYLSEKVPRDISQGDIEIISLNRI